MHSGCVDGATETTGPQRRRVLSALALVGILLLQLTSEYLGTRDPGRFLLKATALVVGLPVLVLWGSALFRWSSRNRHGILAPLFVGALVSGLGFAALLSLVRLVSVHVGVQGRSITAPVSQDRSPCSWA